MRTIGKGTKLTCGKITGISSILCGNSIILPNALIRLYPDLPQLPQLVWNWMCNMLNVNSGIVNLDDCLLALRSVVSAQCKVVFRAAVIVVVNNIWCARNHASPPSRGWMKVNLDGVFGGVPVMAAYGDIFKDHFENHVGSFACNLGNANALFAELMELFWL
ncbi:hypothetical protein KIW84_021477 [Lathyrus oleraceus]|uniref:Uncharacterized protein n=1 Tax=Pisum sativum TaxID=3888 RepID=A0A9D5B414_PEA|nr:hypothetical protein KIW84_021477 [Pisum sativum]